MQVLSMRGKPFVAMVHSHNDRDDKDDPDADDGRRVQEVRDTVSTMKYWVSNTICLYLQNINMKSSARYVHLYT